MSSGLQAFSAGGATYFDSDDAKAGVIIDVVQETSGTQSQSYPDFAGFAALVEPASGIPYIMPTVSYGSGYPEVSFAAFGPFGPVTWAVFATS